MLEKKTLEFLRNLEANNDREWFQANKEKYEAAKINFAAFIANVIERIAEFDDDLRGVEVGQCVFRIFRDVRFSKNKDPYKTHFGAFMADGGRKSMNPGYYLHLDPRQSFIAGGVYRPDPERLLSIRRAIAERTDEFLAIISEPHFQKLFGEVSSHGEQLVKMPPGFPKDHKAGEYLKFKTYIVSRNVSEKEISDPEFVAA